MMHVSIKKSDVVANGRGECGNINCVIASGTWQSHPCVIASGAWQSHRDKSSYPSLV